MIRVYLLSCRDIGLDCDFEARGASLEEVMQRSAEHGATVHHLTNVGPEHYLKMHREVRLIDEEEAPTATQPPLVSLSGSHPLDVTMERVDMIDVIHVAGRLDNATAEVFDEQIQRVLVGQGTRVVLDLARTTYVSSAGLRSLLLLRKQLEHLGGALVLVAAQPRVQDVLDIAGFASTFMMAPTQADGLTRLQQL